MTQMSPPLIFVGFQLVWLGFSSGRVVLTARTVNQYIITDRPLLMCWGVGSGDSCDIVFPNFPWPADRGDLCLECRSLYLCLRLPESHICHRMLVVYIGHVRLPQVVRSCVRLWCTVSGYVSCCVVLGQGDLGPAWSSVGVAGILVVVGTRWETIMK